MQERWRFGPAMSRPPGPEIPQCPIPRPLCIAWALTICVIAGIVGWLTVEAAKGPCCRAANEARLRDSAPDLPIARSSNSEVKSGVESDAGQCAARLAEAATRAESCRFSLAKKWRQQMKYMM